MAFGPNHSIQDTFTWNLYGNLFQFIFDIEFDLSDNSTNIELFAKSLCVELDLPAVAEMSIANEIRKQLEDHRLTLYSELPKNHDNIFLIRVSTFFLFQKSRKNKTNFLNVVSWTFPFKESHYAINLNGILEILITIQNLSLNLCAWTW